LEIIYLESVDSTQTYLKEHIKTHGYHKNIAIVTTNQTNGIGSRDNKWESKKGNLFFSFTQTIENLPSDLKLQSASIYFSFLLKNLLLSKKSKVWLKWPNDFYLEEKKIGGTITQLEKNILFCGIGLNLRGVSSDYGYLDIDVDIDNLLNEYFTILTQKISWKQVFSQYKIEYELSKKFQVTLKNQKTSLADSTLCEDGSILIANQNNTSNKRSISEKVYSSR
jgi:BirA family transcriptional regulator, biotin operon repressor / biotin---[acetyl-CoA-carboxylase] ligase